MLSAAVLALALVARPAAAGSPGMVTKVDGAVSLRVAGATRPVPAVPFLLQDGTTLVLEGGATAVVLVGGRATLVRGPRQADLEALRSGWAGDKQVEAPGALDDLFSRPVSTSQVGAVRAGGVAILRPVPGSEVFELDAVRWSCDACGAQTVRVESLMDARPLWTGKGEGAVRPELGSLPPGPLTVTVGALSVSTTALGEADPRVRSVEAALESRLADLAAEGVDDSATLAQVRAATWLQAGFPSQALAILDEALALDLGPILGCIFASLLAVHMRGWALEDSRE